jgi:Kelch motif
LYVIGGSDGQTSLVSTEILDIPTGTWHVGPSLCTPRANMGVAVIGHRLFAVGGYSGKSFLNSVEFLSDDGEEWCSYKPHIDSDSDESSVLSTFSGAHSTSDHSEKASDDAAMRWCNVSGFDSCHQCAEDDQAQTRCELDGCEQKSEIDDGLFVHDS